MRETRAFPEVGGPSLAKEPLFPTRLLVSLDPKVPMDCTMPLFPKFRICCVDMVQMLK